jgi:hypothetical protein
MLSPFLNFFDDATSLHATITRSRKMSVKLCLVRCEMRSENYISFLLAKKDIAQRVYMFLIMEILRTSITYDYHLVYVRCMK